MTSVTQTRPTLRDAAARESYLLRFAWAMQDYPAKEYRHLKADLRAQIADAAAAIGLRRALADLGSPVVLAEGYLEALGTRRPRWTAGIVVAGVAVGVLAFLTMTYAFGALDALEAMGGGTMTRHPFGAETIFTATADELSVQGVVSWRWALLYAGVAAVAFLLGSRAWRAVGR